MRILGAFVGLLVAGTAAAEPPPRIPGEVRLATAAEIGGLCEELSAPPADRQAASERDRARSALYVMRLPSSAFAFRPHDAARQRLSIDDRRGFRSPTGSYELVLHDLAGSGERPGGLDMALPASPREAAALGRARKAGELSLTLWFRVARGHPERPPCGTVHAHGGVGVRLAVEPAAFVLAREGETIASAESPEVTTLREDAAPAGPPRVVIAPPVLTRTRGRAPESVARVAAELEPAALTCYREGLAADASLRGTLVLGLTVTPEGRVTEARTELDGLGAPRVASCVSSALRATRFPRSGADRFSIPFKFAAGD